MFADPVRFAAGKYCAIFTAIPNDNQHKITLSADVPALPFAPPQAPGQRDSHVLDFLAQATTAPVVVVRNYCGEKPRMEILSLLCFMCLRPDLLAACWAASIFAFFSLSSSKLPGYILPVVPALALLLAPLSERLSARRWRTLLGLLGVGALVLTVAAAPRSPGSASAGHSAGTAGNHRHRPG